MWINLDIINTTKSDIYIYLELSVSLPGEYASFFRQKMTNHQTKSLSTKYPEIKAAKWISAISYCIYTCARPTMFEMSVQGRFSQTKARFNWFLLPHYRCDNLWNQLVFLGEIKNLQTLLQCFSSTICRVGHINNNNNNSIFSIAIIQ